MKYFKNINPFTPAKAKEVIPTSKNKIISKALMNNSNIEIRSFSFAKGESIDTEYYETESLFLIFEGQVKILYNISDEIIVNEGDMIALASDINYGLEALTDVKLLSILVKF